MWNISRVAYWQSWSCVRPAARVAFPIYIAALCLSLQRECLKWQRTNARAFLHLSLCVMFITTITLAVNNDDGSRPNWERSCDVLVLVVSFKYAIWLVLNDFWLMTALRSADKDQQESRAVAENRTYDAVVKFDTYQNLQWHRAVLRAITCHSTVARLLLRM